MYVNHEGVGCMGDFTKEGYTTQHIHHTTCHRDVTVLTSVFLQRRRCGGCLRGEVYLMFVLIAK